MTKEGVIENLVNQLFEDLNQEHTQGKARYDMIKWAIEDAFNAGTTSILKEVIENAE